MYTGPKKNISTRVDSCSRRASSFSSARMQRARTLERAASDSAVKLHCSSLAAPSALRVVRSPQGARWESETVRTLTAAGPACGARDRVPAAFARILACWNASAAMSDTNFCAASDRRRFLGAYGSKMIVLRTMGVARTNMTTHNRTSSHSNPTRCR